MYTLDEKKEDISAHSMENHLKYYRSLHEISVNMQREMSQESDDKIISYLKNRIDAISKDKKRIESMFPDVDWNEIR